MGLLDAEAPQDFDWRIGGQGQTWDRSHCTPSDVADKMVEVRPDSVAGIGSDTGLGIGAGFADTEIAVSCTEPGMHP